MLAELLNVFGITNPLSSVVEFMVVVMAVGFGYELVKGFWKK